MRNIALQGFYLSTGLKRKFQTMSTIVYSIFIHRKLTKEDILHKYRTSVSIYFRNTSYFLSNVKQYSLPFIKWNSLFNFKYQFIHKRKAMVHTIETSLFLTYYISYFFT